MGLAALIDLRLCGEFKCGALGLRSVVRYD
jgi:hypothetical protein